MDICNEIPKRYLRRTFISSLLKWYNINKRKFAWRETEDPYSILIAEILLHRTDAKKANEVYHRFIEKCPTIYHLYKIEEQEILNLIKNIGLFYRSRRLKIISEQIVNQFKGKIPDQSKELMSLQGVGKYISNAIMCFAFVKRVPIVDTNIIRIFTRVFNIKSEKKRLHNDKIMWTFAEHMLPKKSYVEYNYALLDFAANICRAKKPLCNSCFLKNICKNPPFHLAPDFKLIVTNE